MARTVFVGDVHGCARELGDLLDRVAPTSDDHVYFVGDLIARGPDTSGVLRLFREVGASGVRGNHEARVLDARRARLQGQPADKLGPSHEALFERLGDADWALLESLPLYLDVPAHGVRVVHAGVVPDRPFGENDAWTLTHIRSVDDQGLASSEPGADSWAARYAGSPHVIFGHDARRGLQLHPAATGLDTACVYGSALTALVLPENSPVPGPEERRALLVSVPAHGAYYSGQWK
jgi:hypothetical protein